MLEPVLPHNVAEDNRLKRYQVWTFIAMPVVAVLYFVLIAIPLNTPRSVDALLILSTVVVAALLQVTIALRRVILYKRDVDERDGVA